MPEARHAPVRSIASLITVSLLLLLAAGMYATRGGDPSLAYNAAAPLQSTAGLVDQAPLQTARQLSAQAATAPEVEYAQQADQVADNEVDLAFAQALHQATEQQAPLAGEALKTAHSIATLAARIQTEQDHLKQPATPNEDTELEQAQLAVDQDDLDDLQQDLIRLGGDRKARIQQALNEHEAVQKLNDGNMHNEAAQQMETPEALRTLPGKLHALFALSGRAAQLEEAQKSAQVEIALLTKQHDALDATAAAAAQRTAGENAADAATPPNRDDTLGALHAMATQRTTLAALDKRIHDEQQLVDTYGRWQTLVQSQRKTVLHRIFVVLLFIVTLLAGIFTVDGLIRRAFARRLGARRFHTLRIVVTVALQVVGLLFILVILFGTPQQTPTIIGIVTAGITVVLKDFIVAFFGWFVLMGKNGVRVGDWVEINGVSGEVTELGIIRTTLLETGDWSESAQPTGRRVTFMNGYAIEGRFFNFSTTGQWLWDEVRVTVPSGSGSAAMVDAIRAAVEERTREDVASAEQDWQRATQTAGSSTGRGFTATPSVDLRPTGDSIQVTVRYITRAQERAEVRSELYEKAIGILHAPQAASQPEPPTSAEDSASQLTAAPA